MNNVKYKVPDGKLGGITIIKKAHQKRSALENGELSVAKLNKVMLKRGYVRCGLRATA